MPKIKTYPGKNQIAIVKLPNCYYRTVIFYETEGENRGKIKYFQVQKFRNKIANFNDKEIAIRQMMAEANYELQNLFNKKNMFNFASVRDTGESIMQPHVKNN